MFGRSIRKGAFPDPPTPCNVGPTTYIICDRPKIKYVCYRAPFLSSGPRLADTRKQISDIFYDLNSTDRPTGGNSPRFTSPRFTGKVYCSPGPGDYEQDIKKVEIPRGKGNLYVCTVPLSVRGKGPSIPTDKNENGYDLDKDGNPFPNPPTDHDRTLGPAFYASEKPDFGDWYKGCKWSKRTEKRVFFETKDGPGPADYDVEMPSCRTYCADIKARELAKKNACQFRYLDEQQRKCIRENLPGPAHYDVSKKDICKRCEGIYPRPLVTQSERFKDLTCESPGPADYDVKQVKYNISKIPGSFGTRATRFKRKFDDHPMPGPSDYYVPSPMMEKLMSKCNEFALHTAPFNQSAERELVPIAKDAECTPSPANYTLADGKKCKILTSSIFKSKTRRFAKDVPTTGHYNVDDALKNVLNQKTFSVLRVSFNARAQRKTFIDTININNPGPGEYNPSDRLPSCKGCKGFVLPLSPRFTCPTDSPGPGRYKIPISESAMYPAIKSHNLLIKESVGQKKLRRHPRETRLRWAKELRREKKLRCYYDEICGFSHCPLY